MPLLTPVISKEFARFFKSPHSSFSTLNLVSFASSGIRGELRLEVIHRCGDSGAIHHENSVKSETHWPVTATGVFDSLVQCEDW